MEGLPTSPHEPVDFDHYLRAITLLEDKYKRSEIRLEDLLYGYDQVQAAFYRERNPGGPDYHTHYQAAVTYEGNYYTKFKSIATENLSPTQRRELELAQLIEKIGSVLDRETITTAFEAVRNPDLTESDYRALNGSLVSAAIRKLNE